MKLYSCTVRLAGSLLNTVNISAATVPELAILQIVHGQGSVVSVREAGEDVVTRGALLTQLRNKYDRTTSVEQGKPGIVERTFPGMSPRLPIRLDEVGLTLTREPLPEPAPAEEIDLEEAQLAEEQGELPEIPIQRGPVKLPQPSPAEDLVQA